MTFALPIAGLLIALASLGLPAMVYMFPRIGVQPLRHIEKIRIALGVPGFLLAFFPFLATYSTYNFIMLMVTLFIIGKAYMLYPYKIFTALNKTRKVHPQKVSLEESARIIGLTVGKESVAWPIEEVLAPRLLVNDNVSGRPTLTTYCPVSAFARVFNPELNGRLLTFSVIGIWRNNILMRDHQTRSIWQQATGTAVSGPLKGEKLKPVLHEQMTWGMWQTKHPNARLGIASDDAPRPQASQRMVYRYMNIAGTLPWKGLNRRDNRLSLRDEIAAVELNGRVKAYAMSLLTEQKTITDTIGEKTVTLHYDDQADLVHVRGTDGPESSLPVLRSRWIGWSEHNPETELRDR